MSETTDKAATPPAPPAVRLLRPVLAILIALSGLFWAADVYRMVGFVFLAEQLLAVVFGLSLALVFIHFPARRGTERGPLPWYDARGSRGRPRRRHLHGDSIIRPSSRTSSTCRPTA